VIAALAEVMSNQTKASTGTRLRLLELTAQLLDQRHGTGVVPIPSTSTLSRLIADLDRGRMTTGSAKTRRSLANRPDLTIMLDVATRSIVSAVLRPGSTKSVDLVVALARALVPYDQRPDGRLETRALTDGAFDGRELMPDQDLDAYRRRQPYIFPDRIATDRGKIYISDHFENACERLHISLTLSASYTPTDKAKVERTFQSINTGFTQYLKNYTGRGVEYRGVDVEPSTLHSLVELQELLDEWIAVVWQNRPHDSLRDPLHPAVALSPNEMFRAYQELAPSIQIPFDVNTYISLLPVKWRTLQAYGMTIDHRTDDCAGLRALRRTKSTYPGHGGKWPIHVDPYNLQTVWIPVDNEWVPPSGRTQQRPARCPPMSGPSPAGPTSSPTEKRSRATLLRGPVTSAPEPAPTHAPTLVAQPTSAPPQPCGRRTHRQPPQRLLQHRPLGNRLPRPTSSASRLRVDGQEQQTEMLQTTSILRRRVYPPRLPPAPPRRQTPARLPRDSQVTSSLRQGDHPLPTTPHRHEHHDSAPKTRPRAIMSEWTYGDRPADIEAHASPTSPLRAREGCLITNGEYSKPAPRFRHIVKRMTKRQNSAFAR